MLSCLAVVNMPAAARRLLMRNAGISKFVEKLTFTCSLTAGIVFSLILCSFPAKANSIDISAVPANWLVSGAGATNAVPFLVSNHLSITSTQTEGGTFISGGSLAGFDGFWT